MRDWRWGPGTRSPSRVPGGWLTTWRFTSRIYRHLPLKESKRETIEKIPKPLRHKTYSSKRQPEFGKTRENEKLKNSRRDFLKKTGLTLGSLIILPSRSLLA